MTIDEAIIELEAAKANLRFTRLQNICSEFFGKPRIKGSHHIFKTTWQGDPRINLQKDGGKAKEYQIEQVVAALKKLKATQE
ncbi:MAG: hypothetical protein MSG64_04020 [Pyrinomonadaceae bacterium MAG19_C2-C3]|nr:hypothetical protein [Pyrinomonadaceae bacterium MAG19_C2-C3]